MKITAIIPTYNRAEFLSRTINSVLNQTYTIDEILLIDDGSTDQTQIVLEKFKSYMTVIQTENFGVSHARNIGIKSAKNDWLAFLDSDDEWCKDKIEKQIKLHEKNNILFSHTAERWIRDGKNIKYPNKLAKPSGMCFLDNLSTCKIAASSVMVHKRVLNDVGLFDESMSVCEDYDMWLRVSEKYKVGLVKEEGIIKHAGHKQLSSTIFAIDRYHIYSLQKFLECEYNNEVKKEIIKKSNILIKGALKHNNKDILDKYTSLLKLYM